MTVTCSSMYHVNGEHLLIGTGSLASDHPRPTQVLYTNTVFLAWTSMEGGGREGGDGCREGGEGGAEEGRKETKINQELCSSIVQQVTHQ